jgi:photosystem II stability/assembly factor-like uncharacterized protein
VALQQRLPPKFWIYRTTDGARHWQKQFAGVPEGAGSSIHFFDRSHGFVYAGSLYRTDDAGAQWTSVSLPQATPYFTFATPSRGWALAIESETKGSSRLYSTQDGGATWRLMPETPPWLVHEGPTSLTFSFGFRADGEGWSGVESTDPAVYSTLDGGQTWQLIRIPPFAAGAPTGSGRILFSTSVKLLPDGGVIVYVFSATTSFGTFTSFDLGRSWRAIPQPSVVSTFDELSFVDAQHWWVLSLGDLLKTSDAGATWQRLQMSTSNIPGRWFFESAHVIDAQHGWMTMTSGQFPLLRALAMTNDGGVHWQPVSVPQPS